METFYTSIPEFIVKTDDITKLTNRACDNLKLGDEVILLDGDEQAKYNITSKSVDGMKLANITGEAVVEVIYSKEGNVWSYIETKTTELGGGTSFKMGNYIFNEDTGKYEWVEELSEDYTGFNLYIGGAGDEIGIYSYENGKIISDISFNYDSEITARYGNEETTLSSSGVSRINFVELTHSFNELDPTLKALCETAVSTSQPQTCTQAQWNDIKALLDKSLYFYYNGYSLIRTASNGINQYMFGFRSHIQDYEFTLLFNYLDGDISISYNEA